MFFFSYASSFLLAVFVSLFEAWQFKPGETRIFLRAFPQKNTLCNEQDDIHDNPDQARDHDIGPCCGILSRDDVLPDLPADTDDILCKIFRNDSDDDAGRNAYPKCRKDIGNGVGQPEFDQSLPFDAA